MASSIGIDLSSNKISVVEIVKAMGGFLIRNAAVIEIPQHAIVGGELKDSVALSKSLTSIWKEYKLSNKRVHIGISGQRLMIKEIKLPVQNIKEIDNSIKYQINDYLPISADNVIYDYYVIEKIKNSSIIMLAAAMKTMIANITESMKNARLVALAVEMNCFALFRLISYTYNFNKNRSAGDKKAFCIVNIGSDISIIGIVKDNNLRYPRFSATSISTFINNISKKINKDFKYCKEIVKKFDFEILLNRNLAGEKDSRGVISEKRDGKESIEDEQLKISSIMKSTAEQLINEIKFSIEHFIQENPNYTISKVIITGEKINNFRKYIEKKIKYEVNPLNIGNYFSFDYLKKKPAYKDKDISNIAKQAEIGIGIALRGLIQ